MQDAWDYYTVTTDYMATGEGHTRAMLIIFAKNEQEARKIFGLTFGAFFALSADVVKGIEIGEYQDLVTEYAKKLILRVKSKSDDAPPMFSYSNSVHVNYS